jgi:hypothetical protein
LILRALITLLILYFYSTKPKTAFVRLFSCIDFVFQEFSSQNSIREFSCIMSGHGRPRGAHRSTLASLNPSLPISEDQEQQDPTKNDERMDMKPVRSQTRAGSAVASLSAQPVNGSAPLCDWPADGELEDAVLDEAPTVPLSQPVLETPIPFGETI